MRARNQKRRRISDENPLVIDYRSPVDDGWYGVRFHLIGQTLTVSYVGFSAGLDERFATDLFRVSHELEAFRQRIWQTSVQLQDGQCRWAAEETTVCAARRSSEGNVCFYDAIVKKVCAAEHKVVDGEEKCFCTFVLVWIHGPGAGSTTYNNVGDICLLGHGNIQIHPLLDSFVNMSQEQLDPRIQSSHDCECGFSDACQVDEIPKDTVGKRDLSCHAKFQHSMRSSGFTNLEMEKDVDLGSGNMYRRSEITTKCHYFVIDNLESDLSPTGIMDFIYHQTSVPCKAFVVPMLSTEHYASGIVFLQGEECFRIFWRIRIASLRLLLAGMTRMLGAQIWHIRYDIRLSRAKFEGRSHQHPDKYNACFFFKSLKERNMLRRSERLPGNLKVVYKGTREYNVGFKQKELFLEFQHHLQGLRKTLEQGFRCLSVPRG